MVEHSFVRNQRLFGVGTYDLKASSAYERWIYGVRADTARETAGDYDDE
jgi:hypothetical protein